VAFRRSPPHLVRRQSRIAGWGVFAASLITKNTRIIEYTGELISQTESARRERCHLRAGRIWCFNLNRRWVRDGSIGGNIARYINHACQPNCYAHIIGRTIWIRAARRIRRGEELTYDYSTGGVGNIACRCRPGCRGVL
jgi:SET domain-containing protein